MKKLSTALLAGAVVSLSVVAFAGAAAQGTTYKVSSTLTSRADVPAPKSAPNAKGTFTGVYKENATGAVLTWKMTFSSLTGKALAAHIHLGKLRVAGPVLVPLCGPCHSGQTGKVKITKATIAAIEGGRAYVNVHTAKNAGGEIRGQIKATG